MFLLPPQRLLLRMFLLPPQRLLVVSNHSLGVCLVQKYYPIFIEFFMSD